MNIIRDRLRLHSAPDRGMTLIEVMVAIFIFGLVSIGLIYTMTSVLSVTRDSRVRQVAANLAAEEIDLARDIEDVANYGGGVRNVTLNGDTFTVTRTSSWVTNDSTSGPSCGTTGGTLRYKQIRVEVTWGGMRGDTGVISDTLINPNERVTHPDFGTIMVTVANSVPKGFAGVTVTARKAGTSTVVTTGVTDSNGCAYLLMVPPGYYDLTIQGASHEEFISAGTGGTPFEVTNSVAGEASAVLFEVNLAAAVNVNYVHDGSAVAHDQLPTNWVTSLIGGAGTTVSERSGNTFFPRIRVVPDTEVTLVAGDIRTCNAADPQNWSETSTQFQGERIAPVSLESGETLSVDVPVRLVELENVEDAPIQAISQNAGPGCGTPVILTFAADDDDDRLIALPYGHWQFKKGSYSWWSGWTYSTIGSGNINVFGSDSKSGDTAVLDPRVTKP